MEVNNVIITMFIKQNTTMVQNFKDQKILNA